MEMEEGIELQLYMEMEEPLQLYILWRLSVAPAAAATARTALDR
jgi:hypothetical protein